MNRAFTIGLAGVVLVLGGCSSGSGGRCDNGGCAETSAPVTDDQMMDGDGDAAAPTADFGNPDDDAVPTTPVMMQDEPTTDDGDGDGSDVECETGVFCSERQPDSDKCGSLRFESDVEVTIDPGNLLVLFDKSVSMLDPWPGTGEPKIDAARKALDAAIASLQDNVNAGALMFPTYACIPFTPAGGAIAPITDPTQINFQPGSQFLTAWTDYWAALPITGNPMMDRANFGFGTPLNEAFDRADIALQDAGLVGEVAVVVFTDGSPTCFPAADANGEQVAGIPTMPEPERAAAWLADQGIKTYVVGLPGADGVQVLNNIAMSGGTMQYIVPDDPAQLEAELRKLVEETVTSGFDSCSIRLNPAADVPDKLLMIVDEPGVGKQQVPRDRGWELMGDDQVEITGVLCDDAMSGRFTSITFEYACPEAPPPPTLPPVQ